MATFDEVQRSATLRFLQTALIVDDRAEASPPADPQEQPPQQLNVPGLPADAFGDTSAAADLPIVDPDAGAGANSADEVAHPVSDLPPETEFAPGSAVDVQLLADKFADLGLTCGVLKPKHGQDRDTITARIVAAATGADIVVLDYVLDYERNITALPALAQIVATQPGRRLIALYTTWRDSAALVDKIQIAVPAAESVEGEPLHLQVGATRICVFRKDDPDRIVQAPEICATAALPDRLVDVFSAVTRGLVPAIALSALAATRENTHKLLSRMHRGLDVGYAGQLLRVDIEDGVQHLLDVVSGELRAIVEDDQITRTLAGIDGVEAWIDDRETEGLLSRDAQTVKALLHMTGDDPQRDWKTAYEAENGTASAPPEEKTSNLLVPASDTISARLSDAEFAMAMSLRRPYERPEPALQLGAIVQSAVDPARWWICAQPVCDSVRLDAPTDFPMVPLIAVDHDVRKWRFQFVVAPDVDGEAPVHLYYDSESPAIEAMAFTPHTNRTVCFALDPSSSHRVATTVSGDVLRWVAQLKPAHAIRFAQTLNDSVDSRVGLSESEWLRKRARDGKRPT